MTTSARDARRHASSGHPSRSRSSSAGRPTGATTAPPVAAASLMPSHAADDVRIRVVGQLDIDDLLAVPPGARVVVVDAATGIPPGRIVDLPLDGLVDRDDRLRPRSSHALAFPEVDRPGRR